MKRLILTLAVLILLAAACGVALGESAFIHLSRLLVAREPVTAQRAERSEDLRLFLSFCDLVEAHAFSFG